MERQTETNQLSVQLRCNSVAPVSNCQFHFADGLCAHGRLETLLVIAITSPATWIHVLEMLGDKIELLNGFKQNG